MRLSYLKSTFPIREIVKEIENGREGKLLRYLKRLRWIHDKTGKTKGWRWRMSGAVGGEGGRIPSHDEVGKHRLRVIHNWHFYLFQAKIGHLLTHSLTEKIVKYFSMSDLLYHILRFDTWCLLWIDPDTSSTNFTQLYTRWKINIH